jgi:hypothetical protein
MGGAAASPARTDAVTVGRRKGDPASAGLDGALSDLIDDTDFQSLDARFGRFNIFEAVGAVRGELRHSDFLSFILSPGRSHGLGSLPLQRLLRAILARMRPDRRPLRPLEVAVGNLDGAVVHRERDRIDLLVEVRALKLVVAIENKIRAKAGEGQLARYKDAVRSRYAGWRHLFVFLTPDGLEPDDDAYAAFGYADVASFVEGLAVTAAESAPAQTPGVATALRHYVEMLRRHIMPDEELRELALRLYERHKEALDFIIECRPEPGSPLTALRGLVERRGDLQADRHISTILRFVPVEWLNAPALNACPRDEWTRTGRNLLFEAKSTGSDRIVLALVLGPCDAPLRQHIRAAALADPGTFIGASRKPGRKWVTIFSRELLGAAAAGEMEDEEKATAVGAAWEDFCARDLPRLRDEVLRIVAAAPHAPEGRGESVASKALGSA